MVDVKSLRRELDKYKLVIRRSRDILKLEEIKERLKQILDKLKTYSGE